MTERDVGSAVGRARTESARALCAIARRYYDRGWAFATSGNYSVVLQRDPLRLLLSASGRDKYALTEADFVVVDGDGVPVEAGSPSPSAETLLHVVLAADPDVGAVLHTHSHWNTVLSQRYFADRVLTLSGYEMLKGLRGVTTHESQVRIAIVDNTQDIRTLAEELRRRLARRDPDLRHAFLMRGHGLYTWGRDLAEARRHVEALEFLLAVAGEAGRMSA